MKDTEIIDLYWKRDETAIEVTAGQYGGYCQSISCHILHDVRDAEECVNDTWLRAWEAMPPQRPGCLCAWLGKITRNLSLNRFRQYTADKRGRGQTELALSELEDCIPDRSDVEQAVEERVLIQAINQFLYEQPRRKRDIFIRRYWYLCPIREIAENYGISEAKTASVLFRMRNALKAYLEKEGITL